MDITLLLQIILPKLLAMTLVAFVVASIVGAIVGWIATWIWRRSQRVQDSALSTRPARSLIRPAILGSFIGLLLGMLSYEANPDSLIGGPYSGLVLFAAYLLILPTSSITGAILGAIVGAKLPSRFQSSRWVGFSLLATYLVAIAVLVIGLAPPPVVFRTPQLNEPLPVTGQITGYDGVPKDIAFSADGQKLAVSTVFRDQDSIDVWDLNTQKIVYQSRSGDGSRTLKDIVSSLTFATSDQELVTAAPEQVQVRSLANQQVRLRLDGGYVALPMANNRLVTLAVVDAWRATPSPYNLKVWDLSDGKLLQTISADLSPAEFVELPLAASPDGRLLAFALIPETRVEVWDVTTGKQVSGFGVGNNRWINALTFSPDGRRLAVSTASNNPVVVWDWQRGKSVKAIASVTWANQLYWTEAGLLAKSEDRLELLNPQTGALIKNLSEPAPGEAQLSFFVGPIALSPDRKTLAVYTRAGINLWRVASTTN